MHRVVPAFIYFLLVYACAFVTGVVREFLITPQTGLTAALWLELPVMVAVSFFAARYVARQFGVKNDFRDRSILGLLGLALLFVAEEAMSWALRGISVFTLWADFSPLAAVANFAGLGLFAIMPLLIMQRRKLVVE